jgi:hypothetical protein
MNRAVEPVWVLDRFEDGVAVLENQSTREIKNLPRTGLPESAREGDILFCTSEGVWRVDREGTKKRAAEMRDRFRRLLRK